MVQRFGDCRSDDDLDNYVDGRAQALIDAAGGVPGPPGPEGPQGPQGPQGIQGIQGVAGNDGAPGADGADGAQGPQGDVGPQGPAGAQGPAGNDGADGADAIYDVFSGYGAAGVTVSAVQNLPIDTTSITPSASYSLSGDEVTINTAGEYTIEAFVSSEHTSGSARTQLKAWVEINGVRMLPAHLDIMMYLRLDNYAASGNQKLTRSLAVGDVVRVRCQRTASSGPNTTGGMLHIERRT